MGKDKVVTWEEIKRFALRAMKESPYPEVRERAKFMYELASDIRPGERTDAALRIKRWLMEQQRRE